MTDVLSLQQEKVAVSGRKYLTIFYIKSYSKLDNRLRHVYVYMINYFMEQTMFVLCPCGKQKKSAGKYAQTQHGEWIMTCVTLHWDLFLSLSCFHSIKVVCYKDQLKWMQCYKLFSHYFFLLLLMLSLVFHGGLVFEHERRLDLTLVSTAASWDG